MYKRHVQGWSKHIDFILLDELSLQIAFTIAYCIRHYGLPYTNVIYRNLAAALAVIDIIVLVLFNTMHNVLKRSVSEEISMTIKHGAIVFGIAAIYLFATQYGDTYSRLAIFLTFIFHMLIGFPLRLLWKRAVIDFGLITDRKGTMIVVLQPDTAEELMKRLKDDDTEQYKIVGVVLNGDTDQKEIGGIPIVADIDGAASYISREWVDEVYIDAPARDPKIAALIGACHEMAIPIHYHVPSIGRDDIKQFSEKIGGTTVLTSSINYATPLQIFLKRATDIIGGIIGSIIALLIMAIVGPMIKKQSPGPVLYAQERIGKNGKRFKILKIRSMHVNADEKKKELLEQNRIKDGLMFKIEFDLRIIGNEILPDGTQKTGIGEFIRRTSLDEFPQFFNVLIGQMSMVGTRPPTVDEWEKYEYHHRARLSCKPGITGMWQVSGRSEITDFEQVVKLDTEYITNWSLALDVKILLKTIVVLFTKKGAM